MVFSTLLPLFFIVLVIGVLTIVVREKGRRPPTLTERANHPLRPFQVAINEPRKQAQRAARAEAQRAAQEQATKDGAKPERPSSSSPRWLKQV
ncbi:MAG: hypothetical protein ACRD0O_08490 [Acidimicrobiia bacterium]